MTKGEVRDEKELRDIIYLDFEKAASVLSQMDDGFLREIRKTVESGHSKRASGGLIAGPLKAEMGGDADAKTSQYESRVLHHAILTRLENQMTRLGLLKDLTSLGSWNSPDTDEASDKAIREYLGDKPGFVVAEGWARIYDYQRFGLKTEKINELYGFFLRTQLENDPQYQILQSAVAAVKASIAATTDRNAKVSKERRLAKAIQDRDEHISQVLKTQEKIPDWMVEALRLLTDTFALDRVEVRIHPYMRNPHFHIAANLKRECFVDSDIESLLFAYGMQPNALFTLLGITASTPLEGIHPLDAAMLKNKASSTSDSIDSVFAPVFEAFKGLEKMTGLSQYPNITVYPIAVYQRLGSLLPEDEGEEIADAGQAEASA